MHILKHFRVQIQLLYIAPMHTVCSFQIDHHFHYLDIQAIESKQPNEVGMHRGWIEACAERC